jgi:hypothetical protein
MNARDEKRPQDRDVTKAWVTPQLEVLNLMTGTRGVGSNGDDGEVGVS